MRLDEFFLLYIILECLISLACHIMSDVNIVLRLLPIDRYTKNILKYVRKLLLHVHLKDLAVILRYNLLSIILYASNLNRKTKYSFIYSSDSS